MGQCSEFGLAARFRLRGRKLHVRSEAGWPQVGGEELRAEGFQGQRRQVRWFVGLMTAVLTADAGEDTRSPRSTHGRRSHRCAFFLWA